MIKGVVVVVGILHIHILIHLNCVQGVVMVEGGLLHILLCIHLNCVHGQWKIYDSIDLLVIIIMML